MPAGALVLGYTIALVFAAVFAVRVADLAVSLAT